MPLTCHGYGNNVDALSDNAHLGHTCACFNVQDRAAFDEDKLFGLNEIVMDEELAAAILKASRHSMGMDASPVDMSNIVTFCERMVKLAEYRRDLYAYLVDKVRHVSRADCDVLRIDVNL